MNYSVGQPSIDDRELHKVVETMQKGRLTQGALVEEFENAFAARLGCRYAVACSSGTAALHLALHALGIRAGDEVLVPDLTYVATANAVEYTGAKPVLCDVTPDTWSIDLRDAKSKLTKRTRAILPVHLYGIPCDMEAVNIFANAYQLFVVEDAAEGLGGFSGHKPLGRHSTVAAFSFYGNKIITTGEGGMVITDHPEINRTLRQLRGQGVNYNKGRYWHDVIGFNYRMTELQAAIGVVQMQKYSWMMSERKRVMSQYQFGLRNTLTFPKFPNMAPWLFTAMVPGGMRDILAKGLSDHGVETRPVFTPLHQFPMYPDGHYPVSERLANNGLSLPTYPDLTDRDVFGICDMVRELLVQVL